MTKDYSGLPEDLPRPHDDGACAHLPGTRMPALRLPATTGEDVDLAALPAGRTVVFVYPMTGRPGVALPDGWDEIPGARGCTPQNCSIRDLHREFADLGVAVFALSTQSTDYQAEMAERLHLPYRVLSDEDYALADALRLPTFVANQERLIRRLTLVVKDGMIEHVFYPVFPPDTSTQVVFHWLQEH